MLESLQTLRRTHSHAGLITSSGRRGRLIGSLGYILAGFWPRDRSQRRENGRGMPGDRFSGPGDHSGPISGHFPRFRARLTICDLNIVTLPQLTLLRLQQCDIGTIETSETSTLCVDTRQMSALATEAINPVSTADICPVSTADICPVSTEDI